MKPVRFKGIKIHDTEKDTWDLDKAAGLPQDFRSPLDAAKADPDAPSEGPDIRNSLKKYGQNTNKNLGGPAYGN